MRGLLSFSVVLLVLQLITSNAQPADKGKNVNLFVNKFFTLFTEVVHELRNSISEIREEVQILRVNLSQTKNEVDSLQVQTSKDAQTLQDLQTIDSEANADIGRLQTNVSHMSRTIQNLKNKTSETAIQITNLTTLVAQNAIAISTLQSNQSNLTSEVIPFKSNVSHTTTEADQTSKSKDCSELQTSEGYTKSGVYEIYPNPVQITGTKVYCDLETKGGGWTVIQSRSDKGPREDFQRGWQDYENGFGSPDNEHWIGLTNLAALTSGRNQELLIQLTNWVNETREARYSRFLVYGENYRISVGNFSGTAGDSLAYHNDMPFSTKDKDNSPYGRCAKSYEGAWWYRQCHHSNLNGNQDRNGTDVGINWSNWNPKDNDFKSYSLRAVQMKIRPFGMY